MVLEINEFREAITDPGESQVIKRVLEAYGDYLWEAYEKIEGYWLTNFQQIEHVTLVLLSEAPFFGENHSYIYNPEAGATPFFNYRDYEEALGQWGPHLVSKGTVYERKTSLLNSLRALGVLFLDLFPFALNPKTAVNYGTLSRNERRELFNCTALCYFRRKLRLVLEKSTPTTLFVFRYKRVRDSCLELVTEEMEALGINTLSSQTIGGQYGGMCQ